MDGASPSQRRGVMLFKYIGTHTIYLNKKIYMLKINDRGGSRTAIAGGPTK